MAKDTGTVNIHGKEYTTVAKRVQQFRDKHEQKFSIETQLVDANSETVIMKAIIKDTYAEKIVATGYAEEKRSSSMINRTSALENCETSAIGRALAAFGPAGTEYASADEVATAISQQKSYEGGKATDTRRSYQAPKSNKDFKSATDEQKQIIAKLLTKEGYMIQQIPEVLEEEYKVRQDHPLSFDRAQEIIADLKGEPF